MASGGWGGKKNFGCLVLDFGWGFPAKTRRREGFFFNRRGAEVAEDGPGGAGPYRVGQTKVQRNGLWMQMPR